MRQIRRPDLNRQVGGDHEQRLHRLERRSHGQVIYVGTYPTDANTTPESPVFQNGWGNVGGNYPPLAFAMSVDGYVRLEGTCDGGVDGTVVFTLPQGYRPDQSQRFVGALSSGSDFMTVQVDPTGNVTVVARGFDPGTGGLDPSKIATNGQPDGKVLTIVSGVAAWASPTSTSTATTQVDVNGSVIGTRGIINFKNSGVTTVIGADDPADSRVEVTFGISAGGEGQVLTTVSGVPAWHDIATPPSTAYYPAILVSGGLVGTEAKIDFLPLNVVEIIGADIAGTEIDVSIGLTAGADGQVMQTVAGIPVWADLPVSAKTLIIQWFGALPVAAGPTQVFRVPYLNGVLRTFNLQRLTLRVETTGTTATSITCQKSPSGGAFNPTSIGSASVGSGVHEDSETTSLGTVQSGDLVRVNFTAIGAGAASYTVEMEGLEVV